jgi:hypothetical protein
MHQARRGNLMVCNRVGGVGMAYSEWKNDAGQHQIQKKYIYTKAYISFMEIKMTRTMHCMMVLHASLSGNGTK